MSSLKPYLESLQECRGFDASKEPHYDIARSLRGVAQGTIEALPFSLRDWRRGAIALLLWEAADEIERLTNLSGAAK